MAEPFLGEIKPFPYNFAPKGWAMCDGQLMPISQNTALFSLLGTQFGGNGTSNFALPNLQGNVAVGLGQLAGGSSYVIGDTGGSASVTLTGGQLPGHSHTLPVSSATAAKQAVPAPTTFLGATGGRSGGVNVYATPAQQTANPATMLGTAVGNGGGGAPHNNLAPYLVLNFCIALQGIFPSRS